MSTLKTVYFRYLHGDRIVAIDHYVDHHHEKVFVSETIQPNHTTLACNHLIQLSKFIGEDGLIIVNNQDLNTLKEDMIQCHLNIPTNWKFAVTN